MAFFDGLKSLFESFSGSNSNLNNPTPDSSAPTSVAHANVDPASAASTHTGPVYPDDFVDTSWDGYCMKS